MAKKMHFGIKYPFLRDDFQHFYVDVNNNLKEKVRSQLELDSYLRRLSAVTGFEPESIV